MYRSIYCGQLCRAVLCRVCIARSSLITDRTKSRLTKHCLLCDRHAVSPSGHATGSHSHSLAAGYRYKTDWGGGGTA